LESLVSLLSSLLGENLLGVVVYGSSSRREDFTPLSDYNVAVIVREKPPVEEMAYVMEELGPDVSPLFLTLDELEQLIRDGEFIAHEIVRGQLVYGGEEVIRALGAQPPLTPRSVSYLFRHSLACLALSLQNYLVGRPHSAISYAYKSLRSAARFVAARERAVLLSDAEILGYLTVRGGFEGVAATYSRIREVRFKGIRREELLPLLAQVYEASARLLGLEMPDTRQTVEKLLSELAFVADVRAVERDNRVELVILGVDRKGVTREVRVP